MMAKQFNYEVKTTIRLNMHNPDHVLINNVIQNLDRLQLTGQIF